MKTGTIYIVVNKWIKNPKTDETPHKIGKTATTTEERFYGLGLQMPGTFETLCAYEFTDFDKVEKMFHTMFRAKRVCGEWFNISPKDLEDIKSICEKMGGKVVMDEIDEEIKTENDLNIAAGDTDETASVQALIAKIRAVGMNTFVKYHDEFKNMSCPEIKRHLSAREDFTKTSLNTKASSGKGIFKMKMEMQALKIISKAAKVDSQTKREALRLLDGFYSTHI